MVSAKIKRAYAVNEKLFGKEGSHPNPVHFDKIRKLIRPIDACWEKIYEWQDEEGNPSAEDYQIQFADRLAESETNTLRNAELAVLAAQKKDKDAHSLPPSMTGDVQVPTEFSTKGMFTKQGLFTTKTLSKEQQAHVAAIKSTYGDQSVVLLYLRYSAALGGSYPGATLSLANQAMDWQQRMKLDYPLALTHTTTASLDATEYDRKKLSYRVVSSLVKLGSTPIFFLAGIEGLLGPNEAYRDLWNIIKDINPTIAAKTMLVFSLHDVEVQGSHPAKENYLKIITDGVTHRYCLEINLQKYVEDPKHSESAAWLELELAVRVHGRDQTKAPETTRAMLMGHGGLIQQRIEASKNVKRHAKYGWMGSVEEDNTVHTED